MEKTSATTLREYAKFRILKDMIGSVKQNAQFSKEYLIMIADDFTTRILFKETCKMYDLMKAKVFQVEKIEKKRKTYQKTDAIYFISPTLQSIEHLINDFKTKGKPQYGCVHLCMAGHVND
jgi:predicted ATP-grasp superfamily ATP-dependent carboligase